MERNLGDLVLAAASQYGNDVAFQIRRGLRIERLNFGDVGVLSLRIAAWLVSQQLAPGDRIVVWAPNMPEYALLYFSAWLAGRVGAEGRARAVIASLDGRPCLPTKRGVSYRAATGRLSRALG
jgi:long-subunit acyl-CoA synthetase (AMP-forming)